MFRPTILSFFTQFRTPFLASSLVFLSICLAGCLAFPRPAETTNLAVPTTALRLVRVEASGVLPFFVSVDGANPKLSAAGNEWIGVALELSPGKLPKAATSMRLGRFTNASDSKLELTPVSSSLAQIVSVAAELNRAAFVRQNGRSQIASSQIASDSRASLARSVARVLIPLASKNPAADNSTSQFDISKLLPDRSTQDSLLWLDIQLPRDANAGDWTFALELLDEKGALLGALPIDMTVWNFSLPDDRNLTLLGDIKWDRWSKLFPDEFEAITPRLVRRDDARYARAVALFDQAARLAHEHRSSIAFDRLQPTIKWSVGEPVAIDWDDYDNVTRPWLDGSAFADRTPLGMWPMPVPDALPNWPASARLQYWEAAAAHFDALDWLVRSPVWLDQIKLSGGAEADSGLLGEARLLLDSSPRIKVVAPLTFQEAATLPRASEPVLSPSRERLINFATPLVTNQPTQSWPELLRQPPTWLDATGEGLVPQGGYGTSEQDVRLWAWLAFLRNASTVRIGPALPAIDAVDSPAAVDEIVWFYPGKWFGKEGLLPTIQLKWLRRAQQDFEYLRLARERGEVLNALVMARLLTKPVELQTRQQPDPVFGLMTGTQDADAWETAMPLLARTILLREPGAPADSVERAPLNQRMLQWMEPQEKPLIIGRATAFSVLPQPLDERGERPMPLIEVSLGVDIYNASDTTPDDNSLQFTQLPTAWQIEPRPTLVPPLDVYRVTRQGVRATVNSGRLEPPVGTARQGFGQDAGQGSGQGVLGVTFTHGFTRRQTNVPMSVPVSVVQRREGGLSLNGSLDDWTPDDAIGRGPLVRMLDRPGIQSHELSRAATNTDLFATWSSEQFYLAFDVGGLDTSPVRSAQNFVQYDYRRAWGEDLTQVVMQAVFADGSVSLPVHVALKPNGGVWAERKNADGTWTSFESGMRYATTSQGTSWRGELAVPFRAMQSASTSSGAGGGSNFNAVPAVPVLLRFNFTQHQNASATSATWAGPVDQGRDDEFTGALLLVEGKR